MLTYQQMSCFLERWLITLADYQQQCQYQNTELVFIPLLVLCMTQNLRKKIPEKYEALLQ